MQLANSNPVNDIIGTITPVGPITGDPIVGLSKLIVFGINTFLLVASFAVLAYLLWGAFDWVTSSGDKEKVSKAQQKMTYAIVGLVLIIVVFTVFGVVAGDMLGILKKDAAGQWYFVIPTFQP